MQAELAEDGYAQAHELDACGAVRALYAPHE
jgi:hypothetical protein